MFSELISFLSSLSLFKEEKAGVVAFGFRPWRKLWVPFQYMRLGVGKYEEGEGKKAGMLDSGRI